MALMVLMVLMALMLLLVVAAVAAVATVAEGAVALKFTAAAYRPRRLRTKSINQRKP